jgi:hypothetical protein
MSRLETTIIVRMRTEDDELVMSYWYRLSLTTKNVLLWCIRLNRCVHPFRCSSGIEAVAVVVIAMACVAVAELVVVIGAVTGATTGVTRRCQCVPKHINWSWSPSLFSRLGSFDIVVNAVDACLYRRKWRCVWSRSSFRRITDSF